MGATTGQPTYVIIGASLAGGTAAASLRAQGFEGRVVLIGEEPQPPYERPALSKEFLGGGKVAEQFLVRPAGFWAEQEIETLLATRAVRIEPQQRRIDLNNGEVLGYDKLLVATGLRNRTLTVPGNNLPGVHALRTLADAEAIRAERLAGNKAVVVGMGFIGAEVAATLRMAGLEVDVIEPLLGPVQRALGPTLGAVLADIHRDHGVHLHFQESVAALEGGDRVEQVVTSTGRMIACDFVVAGVGTRPRTEVLQGTGVDLSNGAAVDEYCRTAVEGIYAAGDVANHRHVASGRAMRVEHWHNALKQGAAAAGAMLGRDEPYDEVHWFWSDQYDLNIQCAGLPTDWASTNPRDVVIRGDLQARSFVAFTLDQERIQGAIAFNRGKDLRRCIPAIKAGAMMDRTRLADPSIDVRECALPQ